jgi:hypothetical protein
MPSGILLKGFNDVKEGDVLEVYEGAAGRAHRALGGTGCDQLERGSYGAVAAQAP